MNSEIELEIKKQWPAVQRSICCMERCHEPAVVTKKVGRIQDQYGSDLDLCARHEDQWDEAWGGSRVANA